MHDLQVIDENTLGFLKVEYDYHTPKADQTEVENENVGVFKLNLSDNKTEEIDISKLEGLKDLTSNLESVIWFNKDKYILIFADKKTYKIYLVDNQKVKKIAENPLKSGVDEYGVPETSMFSPDGKKLLLWSRILDNSGAWVFDLENNSSQMIADLAFPEWLSKDLLVYVGGESDLQKDSAFYTYDLNSKTKKKIDAISLGVFRPFLLKNKEKIAYSNFISGDIKSYQLKLNKEDLLIQLSNKKTGIKANNVDLNLWGWITPNVVVLEMFNKIYLYDTKLDKEIDHFDHEQNFNLNDVASQYMSGYRKTDAFGLFPY